MAASYPSSVISYTDKVDGVDDVEAAHMNSVQDEIVAIETELGTSPSGGFDDVKARIVDIEGDVDDLEALVDQDVTSGASPTFDGDGFTGIDADDVDIADSGDIITATDVEGALQENRTALDLNTTYRTASLPVCDDGSIDNTLDAWDEFGAILNYHVNKGSSYTRPYVSTYSLAYTVSNAYVGGVLAPNGDIHFVPCAATVGQKVSSSGTVSTYSLAYTVGDAYYGGVLAPNGDIHFVPCAATVGQKVSSSGTVSTYSLAYTAAYAYVGGVLAPNGDIHFVPYKATVGQKVSVSCCPLPVGACVSPWLNKY